MSTSSNKIPLNEVIRLTGFSANRINQLIDHNSFPKPVKSKGSDTLWVEKKVTDWMVEQLQIRGYGL